MKPIQKFWQIFKLKLKQVHALLPQNKFWRIVIYVLLIGIVLIFSLYLWAFVLASAVATSLWAALIAPVMTWLLGILSALGLTSLFTAIYTTIYGFIMATFIFIMNIITSLIAWLGSTYLGAFFLQIHGWIAPLLSKVMPFVSAGKFSKKFMKFIKRAHKV